MWIHRTTVPLCWQPIGCKNGGSSGEGKEKDAMHEPIRRQVTLDAPREDVWLAITDANHLQTWFGAAVELDPRPGGVITVRWPDRSTSRGSVEFVEAPSRFVFRWRSIAGAGLTLQIGDPTRVEFILEPVDDGARTRVTVTEHDAPMPGRPTSVLSARA
jgi:uncharacterized protein YndB with AHSA1/START domain